MTMEIHTVEAGQLEPGDVTRRREGVVMITSAAVEPWTYQGETHKVVRIKALAAQGVRPVEWLAVPDQTLHVIR
jgi:hypothetical protein